MNERIQQLAEQAGFLNKDEESIGYFAELLVQDCIELNRQELAFNAFERMLNLYKAHFGVEE